ncbi:ComF family protein [Nocardia otitidiscaviarum]|uniref:ComF family protein n=1 Tax=Nocardia otitidiscaviarum TaxID=1823 RepID=UPI0004A706DB|nr:ComF family protein [Nocardia otitidiscaviarum]MBF6131913.1 ComF family protein [Nocardia otitidiscaviarum]MBF6483044.1 ComF family protein [Nocardia otitidiscaviarum]
MGELLDLVLPRTCCGCGAGGVGWCAECAVTLAGPPVRARPRADPGVPCWALAPYAGPARRAVLAVKEQCRRELAEPLGLALARGLDRLRDHARPLVLVPAPSRRSAARRRGGDPVVRTALVAAGWLPDCRMVRLLRTRPGVRDSVGLSPGDREHNLRGRIITARPSRQAVPIPANAEVVLMDDVLTTGVTARESVRALIDAGVPVRAVFVTCRA